MTEDLGIKIGTEDEILWTSVMNEAEMLIKQSQNNLKVQTAMLKVAEQMIQEAKETFK